MIKTVVKNEQDQKRCNEVKQPKAVIYKHLSHIKQALCNIFNIHISLNPHITP